MALLFKSGQFTKTITTPAPVSQAVTGVGFQPKAIIFNLSGSNGNDSFDNSHRMGFGIATASTSATICSSGQNAQATTSARHRHGAAGDCILIINLGGTIAAAAQLTSFDSDGFTLNWSDNNVTGFLINYIAIGGTDLTNAAVANWTMPTSTGNKAVTGVGFQPDLVLHFHSGIATTGNASLANGEIGLGAMGKNGNQWANHFLSLDNVATTDTQRTQLTDQTLAATDNSLAHSMKASYVSMDSDGFTTNFTTAPATAGKVDSLCLKGGSVKVGSFNKSTGAAPVSQSITGLGFSPKGFFVASDQLATFASPAAGALLGVGASDGTGEISSWIGDQNGVSPSKVRGRMSNTKIFSKTNNVDPTLEAEADITSLDTDGWTHNLSTNDAVATEFTYWAMGNTPASANTNRRTMGYGI